MKRLGEIVVGADPEARDAVLDRPGGGEHQHGALAGVDQRPADVIAVDVRQVAIEHDHVIAGDRRPFQRLPAVEGEVDRHPFPA